jgi:hypothetical protein
MTVNRQTKPDIFTNLSKEKNLVHRFRQFCMDTGYYGGLFLSEFDKTQSSIIFSTTRPEQRNGEGVYYAHDAYGKFTNHLEIPPISYADERDFYELIFHEAIHAIQAKVAAAALVNATLTLSPISSIKLMFAMDIDATVKTGIFLQLYDTRNTNQDTVNEYNNHSYLKEEIQQDANKKLFFAYNGNAITPKSMRRQYVNPHLTYFENNIDYFTQNNVQYYELDDLDLWEIGNSIGIPTFGDTSKNMQFMRHVIMEDADWKRLYAINDKLNITDTNTVPFSHYLKSTTLTRLDFINKQRQDLNEKF